MVRPLLTSCICVFLQLIFLFCLPSLTVLYHFDSDSNNGEAPTYTPLTPAFIETSLNLLS